MRFARRWVLSVGVVVVLAAGAAGAADRCGNADLSTLTSRIYVSPAGTDSDTCGTSSSTPCQSIQRGIDRCGSTGCGVLVRYGLYTLAESIRLRDGVNVYGRCMFGNEPDRKYRSVIEAPPDSKPAITAADINSPTLFDGVFVKGSDATSPGGASIAMTVSDSTALTITNSTLSSGKGADGASGRNGATGGQGGAGQGPPGISGGAGGGACGGGSLGNGGKGADYHKVSTSGCFIYCKCADDNNSQGETGSSSGTAAGGAGGGRGHSGCACDDPPHTFEDAEDGPSGGPGQPGACAAAGGTTNANIWGDFSGTNWVPITGGQGGMGAVGAGGGGGGSGGYGVAIPEKGFNGRPGGGGGGGGCGGEGGVGGQQGGASIVIVLFRSAVTIIEGDVLVPGPGGNGGPGGTGATGGAGGPGQQGAISPKTQVCSDSCFCKNSVPGNGGPGGAGGQGGAGGGGAGGNGGPSLGIAFVSSDYKFSRFIYDVQPGPPGVGVAGGKNAPDQCQAPKGADGDNGGGGKWHHWLYVTASASSSYPGAPPANAIDGDPNTVWNSGGGPSAWIELDLNQIVTLATVRLLVEQSPAGQTTHQLYFGPSPAPTALIATLSGNTKDMQWLEVDAPTGSLTGNSWPTGRYLRVLTTASPSWVAWREIVVQTK